MTRPLRIEFPGAVYHVTSRGDRREAIFADDDDRRRFLAILQLGLERFDASLLAYCLMGNHYHLVLQCHAGGLSRLMRHVNGVYTQAINKRHGLVGHLLQGRFKSILVDRDAYLLELCRCVDLNPVRANMIEAPHEWPWSSYLALSHLAPAPAWLDVAQVWGLLLQRSALTAADARQAGRRYAKWVAQGRDVRLWDGALRDQVYLGDEAFVERMKAKLSPPQRSAAGIAMAQRLSRGKPLASYFAKHADRDDAIWRACREGQYTMTAIARHLDLSLSHISRIVRRREEGEGAIGET